MMHRLIAPALAAAFSVAMALPADAMDLTELTDAERAQFRAEVRAYLMDNPAGTRSRAAGAGRFYPGN